MSRFGQRRLLRSFWEGLVCYGLMSAVGDPQAHLPKEPLHDGPPPGHPERLPDCFQLTALERRLVAEMSGPESRRDRP
jgi:hypothetical protein